MEARGVLREQSGDQADLGDGVSWRCCVGHQRAGHCAGWRFGVEEGRVLGHHSRSDANIECTLKIVIQSVRLECDLHISAGFGPCVLRHQVQGEITVCNAQSYQGLPYHHGKRVGIQNHYL
jgi:hypothetical protein